MSIGIEEHNARLELYKKGYTDKRIADERYTVDSNICAWRKRNGLKPHREKNASLPEDEHLHRKVLYDSGMNDTEIAAIVGVGRDAITAWRKKNGLKKN